MQSQLHLEILVFLHFICGPNGSKLIEIIVTHLIFETGSDKYKDLETSVFVSAGRFIVEENKPIVVEYKVSKVTHS